MQDRPEHTGAPPDAWLTAAEVAEILAIQLNSVIALRSKKPPPFNFRREPDGSYTYEKKAVLAYKERRDSDPVLMNRIRRARETMARRKAAGEVIRRRGRAPPVEAPPAPELVGVDETAAAPAERPGFSEDVDDRALSTQLPAPAKMSLPLRQRVLDWMEGMILQYDDPATKTGSGKTAAYMHNAGLLSGAMFMARGIYEDLVIEHNAAVRQTEQALQQAEQDGDGNGS